MQTVSDISKRLSGASAEEYAVLERSLCADTRKGVQNALAVAKRRLAAEQACFARKAPQGSREGSPDRLA